MRRIELASVATQTSLMAYVSNIQITECSQFGVCRSGVLHDSAYLGNRARTN